MARLGVGAGVDGAAGDLTELVELVRLRIERSILKAFTACSSENSKYWYMYHRFTEFRNHQLAKQIRAHQQS